MSFANGDSVWDSCCCNEWQLVGFPITAFWDFGGDIYCFTCLHLGHTKDHMSECAWRAELGNSPGWSPSLSSGEPQVEGPADTSIRWGLAATVECFPASTEKMLDNSTSNAAAIASHSGRWVQNVLKSLYDFLEMAPSTEVTQFHFNPLYPWHCLADDGWGGTLAWPATFFSNDVMLAESCCREWVFLDQQIPAWDRQIECHHSHRNIRERISELFILSSACSVSCLMLPRFPVQIAP